MDSDWATSIKEVNGIDLANYLPQQRSYNSVVYIHKKYFHEHKRREENKKLKEFKTNNLDKSQQIDNSKNVDLTKEKANKIPINNESSVIEQTIKFAKNIVPLVLPPGEDKSQVYYTIKTARKRKKQDKKRQESSIERIKPSNDREDSKKVIETYRKVRKESISVKESFSHSSNNTLDDLNINQSLCCTFSEVSEKKYHKKSNSNARKRNQDQKFSISESFEAIATEKTAGEGKIKINLMNEKDKEFLSDSIKNPILKALGDYILELHNTTLDIEACTMQKSVKCNSQKLDNIIDKLTCIEKKLDGLNKYNDDFKAKIDLYDQKFAVYENNFHSYECNRKQYEKTLNSNESKPDHKTENRRVLATKLLEAKSRGPISTLEDLAEDIIEIKEDYSSEEELHHEILDRRSKSTLVEELKQEQNSPENLGGGELPRSVKGVSIAEAKLVRPKRLPARFCWTDTGKNN